MVAYKGSAFVVACSSENNNLYSETESSIDILEGISLVATSGFITIRGICLEKYDVRKTRDDKPLAPI